MSEPSEADSAEGQWAKARFHDYLLHRLDEDAEDRVIAAVATVSGLAYDLADAEESLIRAWLDRQLPAEDREDFLRCYVNGPEANRAKVKVHQALRTAKFERSSQPPEPVRAPIPFPRRGPARWMAGAVAASLLACLLAALLYREAGQNAQLRTDLAVSRSQSTPRPQTPGPRTPRSPQTPVEQPAGMSPEAGLTLAAGDSGKTFAVAAAPGRLIWSPVPDYRSQYRIRVSSPASGREQTSSRLTPQDNSIEYALDAASPLPLPWDVTILGPDGAHERALAHYTLVKP